ncbi:MULTISPECIES: STAS domain-containing protein [Streptomyces]|uniref:STAS domain-containing protein n=1 Tax=Streptomyces TaxID=1883 RepID=UPI0004CBE660|nr:MULTISPECIES: STAS domain-containing protein [unclassified Streptomyces]KPC83343.1 anti-anti-sigma factor [Streptomyces sp. NRRL S-4]
MNPLTTTVQETGTGTVLRVAGELDYSTAAELRQVVTGLTLGPDRPLVLDLGRLDFCDSSGITAFIVARNHATAAQARITLVNVPGPVLRVLHVTGLDQVFTLEPGTDKRNRGAAGS